VVLRLLAESVNTQTFTAVRGKLQGTTTDALEDLRKAIVKGSFVHSRANRRTDGTHAQGHPPEEDRQVVRIDMPRGQPTRNPAVKHGQEAAISN
jgi:hypothetical protein